MPVKVFGSFEGTARLPQARVPSKLDFWDLGDPLQKKREQSRNGCRVSGSGSNKRTLSRPKVNWLIYQFINLLMKYFINELINWRINSLMPAAHFFHKFCLRRLVCGAFDFGVVFILPTHLYWKWFEFKYSVIARTRFVKDRNEESVK